MTKRHPNEKWTYETVKQAALSCETRYEFRKRFAGAEKWAIRKGVYEEMCQHMRVQFRWTFDLVKKEAAKYTSRNDFHEGNPSAAQWAVRNNRMADLFEHQLTFWDFESVSKEALKFSYREQFRVGAAGASQWAMRNGVWDTVCAHMDLASKSDYDCVYIWKPEGFDDLYKIGVTSKRLGTKRIEYVSGNNGMNVELLYIKHIPDALRKEKEMLSLGKPANFSNDFDGFSEFRHLSDSEFLECLRIMSVQKAGATS